jgi:hypothetical protein
MLAATRLAEVTAANEPHDRLGQVVPEVKDDRRRQRAEAQRHAPHQVARQLRNDEDRNDPDGQNLADREHELPAVAHHLALAARHGLHDVGVSAGDVASQGNAEDKPHDDQPHHVRHEGLRQREDHEHAHGREEDDTPTELVGEPAADDCADEGTALGSRRGQAE